MSKDNNVTEGGEEVWACRVWSKYAKSSNQIEGVYLYTDIPCPSIIMVGSGNPCLLIGIEITSWKMCVQHDSVLVEKEESRFTPYRISYADEVPHHLIDSGDQDNGVGHFYAPFDYTTYVMDNATMGVQIKAQKQTQKQFAHLHNQHRKKVCFWNSLVIFLFSCGTFSIETSLDSLLDKRQVWDRPLIPELVCFFICHGNFWAWQMNSANALQPSFLFSKPLDPKKLAAANITTLHNTIPYHSCGRTGRGGCLIFDRWNPLTWTPLDSSSKLFSSFGFAPALDRWEASQLPSFPLGCML